jgi:hypothetical protein
LYIIIFIFLECRREEANNYSHAILW